DLEHSYESARDDIADLSKEVSNLTDQIEGRESKRRRLDTASAPGPAPASDDMIVDDEGGPGVNMASRQPVESSTDQATARFTETSGTWVIPNCIDEARSLLSAMKKAVAAEQSGIVWRAGNLLRKAYTKAIGVKESKKNDFHRFIIVEYRSTALYKQDAAKP
ncbi:hypothetical protein V5O48_019736, partial [Marasmius crinis-equi]